MLLGKERVSKIRCGFRSPLSRRGQTAPWSRAEDKRSGAGHFSRISRRKFGGVGIQFTDSEAWQFNSISKNGRGCSNRKSRTMDLHPVRLKKDLFRRTTANDSNSGNSGPLVRLQGPRHHYAFWWLLRGQAERRYGRHTEENTSTLIAEIDDSNIPQLTETG